MSYPTIEKNKMSFSVQRQNQPLHNSVRQAVENLIEESDGNLPKELYRLVLAQVEEPLLQQVMQFTKGNQSEAAIVLGISRGTFRKKLKIYGMLDNKPKKKK